MLCQKKISILNTLEPRARTHFISKYEYFKNNNFVIVHIVSLHQFAINNLGLFQSINLREYQRGNQILTIQRNGQHRVHKTKTNKTKTIQRNGQHRIHKTKTNKTKTIQRNGQHRVHKTKTNKTKNTIRMDSVLHNSYITFQFAVCIQTFFYNVSRVLNY